MSPLNAAICTTITYTLWVEWYYVKNSYLTMHIRTICPWTVLLDLFDLGQGPTKVITVCDTPPYGHAPTYQLSLTYLEEKNVMACTRKYYLKNNHLTLRSKVKVPQRSLRYATHRLMVMHPHTNYHWPTSKDKNVMAWTRKYYLKNNYLTLRSRSHKGHYSTRHTAIWSCTHIPIIIDLSRKTKMLWPGQENTI
jgi:hypothetical protein